MKLFFYTEPNSPSSKHQSSLVDKNNFYIYLKNLVPVSFLLDNLVELRIFQNKWNLNKNIFENILKGNIIYPKLIDYLFQKYDYMTHKEIFNFFNRYKFVPPFKIPRQNKKNVKKTLIRKKKI